MNLPLTLVSAMASAEATSSFHANHAGGNAKVQYGHQYNAQRTNETHHHYHYGERSQDSRSTQPAATTGVSTALARFPGLIKRLLDYAKTVRRIQSRKWNNYADGFSMFHRAVIVEFDLLRSSLHMFLRQHLERDKVLSLLTGYQSSYWSDPRVDAVFRLGLSDTYEKFSEETNACAHHVEGLRKELSLGVFDVGDEPESVTRKTKAYIRQKMPLYKELVARIKASNKIIGRLLLQDAPLDPIVMVADSEGDFAQSREHGRNIFELLKETLVKSCTSTHKASLCMRTSEREGGLKTWAREQSFRVILQHDDSSGRGEPLWTMQEAEIRLRPEVGLAASPDMADLPLMLSSLAPYSSQQERERKIRDLCKVFQRQDRGVSLGYLSDELQICLPREPFLQATSPASLTLADILKAEQSCRLSLVDRRILAYGLAIGMLRLYNTPWLGTQWGKNDVSLFLSNGKVIAEHPFISVDMAVSQDSAHNKSWTYFTSCPVIVDQTIFALGILLIELALRKPFEMLKVEEDQQWGIEHADFYAAMRLIGSVRDEAGPRYGNVVERCVRHVFDHGPTTGNEDIELAKKVYEGVVAQLELEVKCIAPFP